jgi:hypothetical protein
VAVEVLSIKIFGLTVLTVEREVASASEPAPQAPLVTTHLGAQVERSYGYPSSEDDGQALPTAEPFGFGPQ